MGRNKTGKKSGRPGVPDRRLGVIVGDFLKALPAGKSADNAREIWNTEVAVLESRAFSSLQDAVECVVEQVGDRLHASEAEREFLKVALSTDPEICGELRKRLAIRGA